MERVTAFFHMGGYAWFVWPAFALTVIVLVALALASGWTLKSRQRALAALSGRSVAGGSDPEATDA